MSTDLAKQFRKENFADNEKIKTRALDFVNSMYTTITGNRRKLETWWEMIYNMWRLNIDIQYYKGQSNIYLPEFRKSIEDGVRNLSSKIFPTDDCFMIKPMPGTPQEYAEAVKDLLDFQLFNQMGVKQKLKMYLRPALYYGTGICKTYWNTAGKHPVFKPIDLMNFYVYPEIAENVDDASLTFERFTIDKRVLNEMESVGRYITDDMPDTYSQDALKRTRENLTYTIMKRYDKVPTYDLVECWCDFDIKEGDDPVPTCITFDPNHQVVLEVRENWFVPKKKPYISSPYIQVVDSFYGHGIGEVSQRLQYLVNDVGNLLVDDGIYTMNPIVKMDSGRVNNINSITIRPGARWDVSDPNAAVFDRPVDIMQSGLALVSQLVNRHREHTNIGGIQPMNLTKRVSATEMSAYTQAMSVFINDTVADVEETFMKPLLKRSFDLNQQYLNEEDLVKILGAKGYDIQKLKKINKKRGGVSGVFNGDNEYLFQWLGSTQSMNIHVKSAQMIQFLGVANAIPKTPQDDYKIQYPVILKAIWRDGLGLKSEDQIIKVTSSIVGIDPVKRKYDNA